jgi:hypothetical protein
MNTPIHTTLVDDRLRLLSERSNSAPRVLDYNRSLPRSHCRYNHPVMRRDDSWRDVPKAHQVLCPRKGCLSEVIPLATNGLLVYCSGDLIAHFSNIEWPEEAKALFKFAKAKAPKRPRKSKAAPLISEDDLF